MRVARAAFLAGPALLLVAALVFGASFVADRRHRRHRRVVEDDVDTPAPAPRREWAPRRFAAETVEPSPPEPPRRDSLHLQVAGPHGLRLRSVSVALSVTRVEPAEPGGEEGAEEEPESVTYELEAAADGSFVIDDLEPGRYDLTVSTEELADATLADVPSDAVDVRVALARPPLLLGAIGAGADTCADDIVQLESDDDQREEAVDQACAFAFEGLTRGGPVTLTTVGPPGEDAHTVLPAPAEGDWPPVCLNAPCAALPSALVVLLADSDGYLVTGARVSWEIVPPVARPDGGDETAAGSETSPAVISGLTAGARVRLQASTGEETVESEVIAATGINEIVVTVPITVESDE